MINLESNADDILKKIKDKNKLVESIYINRIKDRLPNVNLELVEIIVSSNENEGFYIDFKGLTKEQIEMISS